MRNSVYMPVASLVSVKQYLRASYRPDRDYIDGLVVERNLGQFDHAKLQGLLVGIFHIHTEKWNVLGLPELRLRVGPRRYRIPDLLVLPLDYSGPQIIEQTPLLCVEILSPDDVLADIEERSQDYLAMGVPETWIFDPTSRRAYVYSAEGLAETPSHNVLRCGRIEIPVEDLFSRL